MANSVKNNNVLLESEGQNKRLIGIVALLGGTLFIIFVVIYMLFSNATEEVEDTLATKANTTDIIDPGQKKVDNLEVEEIFAESNIENSNFQTLDSPLVNNNIVTPNPTVDAQGLEPRGLLDDLGLKDNAATPKQENLVDSVKNDEQFSARTTLEQSTQNAIAQDQQRPWYLTKEGYPRPRIVKGMSVGLISQRGGSEAKDTSTKSNNNEMAAQELENKTLLALNGLIDKSQNIDYQALATANTEMGSAANIGSDTAYRQQGDFKGEVFQPTSAVFSPFNQSLLLPKGTYIPCSLQTKIVSELKGQIGCIVANDIYSANGNTLLIEKGSQINGSYTNADVTDGSSRLYVIWQEIRTPNNIVIPVSSGGVDPLGGAGLPGDRDNHYVSRFGAAILLSVIDGTIKSLGSYVNSQIAPNSTLYNPAQAGQLANTALRQTINIKPTIYKNHGDLVGVYVNKDVDFSKVYELKLRRSR